jgi:quinolinate synthase
MASSTVVLDLLGPQRASEKGTTCPGDLPPASDPELVERTRAARTALGERAFVLGHHYQRDEVIQFADARGDSFRLA